MTVSLKLPKHQKPSKCCAYKYDWFSVTCYS